MRPDELTRVGAALGGRAGWVRALAGGYSHETGLVMLDGRPVVVRLGGADPGAEAAVMARAGAYVPVPPVLAVLPAMPAQELRAAMVLEWVEGIALSDLLDTGGLGARELADLGAVVGAVTGRVGAVGFERPGFFAGAGLDVGHGPPWSGQLAPFVTDCMRRTPSARLGAATRTAWVAYCARQAPALRAVDGQARLVHADLNPKNLLVTRSDAGWRVAAVLDWEFAFSGCPLADAANMTRFADEVPASFAAGFLRAFHQAYADLVPDAPPRSEWVGLGRVFDLFALSDLLTRPLGPPIPDQAADVVRDLLAADRSWSWVGRWGSRGRLVGRTYGSRSMGVAVVVAALLVAAVLWAWGIGPPQRAEDALWAMILGFGVVIIASSAAGWLGARGSAVGRLGALWLYDDVERGRIGNEVLSGEPLGGARLRQFQEMVAESRGPYSYARPRGYLRYLWLTVFATTQVFIHDTDRWQWALAWGLFAAGMGLRALGQCHLCRRLNAAIAARSVVA